MKRPAFYRVEIRSSRAEFWRTRCAFFTKKDAQAWIKRPERDKSGRWIYRIVPVFYT